MYRIHEIYLRPGENKERIPYHIAEKLKRKDLKIREWKIARESVDARRKNDLRLVCTVDFCCDEDLPLQKTPDTSYKYPDPRGFFPEKRPVIAGFGPCGIFAALILAQTGYRPLVLERGRSMEQRSRDVENFWKKGVLDEESNVQFGEGGAGAFSDGKLTTGTKDRRTGKVLEEFCSAGAGGEILYKHKPHIGTDVLKEVVVNLRKKIIAAGGDIRFGSRLTDMVITDTGTDGGERPHICAVEVNGTDTIETDDVIFAVGHSARDTFRLLIARGVEAEQKPFSIGIRAEHLQEKINAAQYGDPSMAELLGPAEYKMSCRCRGRGVYTFCMCPGGQVIPAASSEGMTVVNGMSCSRRDGRYANSGILADVRVSDFGSDDPLAGMYFQEKYERLAFMETGDCSRPPRSCLKNFMSAKNDTVRRCLPEFAAEAIREAMPVFGRKIKGFDDPETILTAVETRSSSPVRFLRDENMMSCIEGLYPGGEGAGYAGGIVSAAVDGIKLAEAVIRRYA